MSHTPLYSPEEIARAIDRMAQEILRDNSHDISLVGLHSQGVPLAEKLADAIAAHTATRPQVGKLDISMYRDDVGMRSGLPLIQETVIPFQLEDRKIILVDDVLSSGRTIRAALDALTDYGRPAMIRLAVLVDRGNPEFPIHADYRGFAVQAAPDEKIVVRLDGEEDIPSIVLQKK